MRIKWLSANITNDLISDLKYKMLALDYGENVDGFRLEFADQMKLSGKYIVKRDEVNTALDPFGNEYTYKTIQYDIYKFSIQTSMPQITLIDPPKSINAFLNKLSELTNYEISISQINIDINKCLTNLSDNFKRVKVIKFTSSSIMLSTSIAGKIILSGTDDVRLHINTLTDIKDITADKVKVKLEDNLVEIEISKNGLAALSGKNINEGLVDSISDTLF